MTALSSYARVLAVAAGRAQPIATVRHVYVSERPLVFVPLTLAGEANAPVAALVGSAPDAPTLLVVPQPRDRDLRFAFAASLARILLRYVDDCSRRVEPTRDGIRYSDAPQVLVPNPAGIAFARLFGRSTRFRRTTGPYPVDAAVPLLGRWLTFLAERAEHPGSCLLMAATDALALHWATGQSAVEDANLAALLGWIAPDWIAPEWIGSDADRSGPAAARRAEDPRAWPPAGPATDPGFDADVLVPTVEAWSRAPAESVERTRLRHALEGALRGQLEPTWDLIWRAVPLLRSLPAGASVAARWEADRAEFTRFHRYVAGGGLPQARRDGAVAAARRLRSLEQEQAGYEAQRAFDDPLVMAVHRATGEAFAGTVVAVDRGRRVPGPSGRSLVCRPLVTVATVDPVHLAGGADVRAATRPAQPARVVAVADGSVTVEVCGGMGRGAVPPPGSVPDVGDELCYTSVLPDPVRAPALPAAEDTPWTHGGPPPPYLPNDDDAVEGWE